MSDQTDLEATSWAAEERRIAVARREVMRLEQLQIHRERRERIATVVFARLCPSVSNFSPADADTAAIVAMMAADSLMRALDKDTEGAP